MKIIIILEQYGNKLKILGQIITVSKFVFYFFDPMSIKLSGVLECKSQEATPQSKSFIQGISPIKGQSNKKLTQFFSTNIGLTQQPTFSAQRSIVYEKQEFGYPSAFNCLEQSQYIEHSPLLQSFENRQNDRNQQSIKKPNQDSLDRIFRQMKELRKNVDNLEKVTNKFSKIYHDSQIVLDSQSLANGRVREFSQYENKEDIEKQNQDLCIEQIRQRLELILQTAISEQQQKINTIKQYKANSKILTPINSNIPKLMTKSVESSYLKKYD